jgi:alginate O-acetyltransferase complex protein AlgI
MRFDSPTYILFLAVVALVYWRLSHRGQNILLLGASYLFYAWWDWRFSALLAFSNVLNHRLALLISVSSSDSRRRLYLTSAVLTNLLILGVFKYCDFFISSLAAILTRCGIANLPSSSLQIVLPLAISFYTFQSLAYVIDVCRHRLLPATSTVNFALLVTLFPHLVAGPIQQPAYLLSQVERPRVMDSARLFGGLLLIVTGLFRKCVIANNCALIANAAFGGTLGPPNAALVLLGAYAFAWQVYADFSGYSNIARGSAQVLGFHFTVNFRQPYLALSIQEFWRRWHISLSTWLRDYLFLHICVFQ